MALILRTLSWCLNGDETQGSIYCRKNYDEPIRPEWQVKPEPESMTGVFVPGSLRNIVLTVRVENTGDDVVDATLSAQEITSDTAILGSPQFPTARFPAHQTIDVQGSVNPATLNRFWRTEHRHKQSRIWRWSYTRVIGGQPVAMGDTLHTLYFLPQLPAANSSLWNVQQGPYDENNKACIWTELLDACSEACDQYAARHGGQAPATDKEYVEAFAAELNSNPAFHYDVWSGACAYLSYGTSGSAIKLKKYLRDRQRNFPNYLNCSDCAAIVAAEALAYGISAYIGHMRNSNRGFLCNPIIAIGCSAWAPPFQGGFSYHAVAVLSAACSETTEIYDACLHLDGGQYPGSQGPQGKNPLLPIAVPFSDTSVPQVNVPASQPFTKNLYRERLVADQEVCILEAQTVAVTEVTPSLALLEKRTVLPGMRTNMENPLPAADQTPVWKRLSAAPFQKLGSWKQIEAYGRYQVYFLTEEDGACIQASFWAALDREEAWILLQTRICEISCPLEPREFADASYGIGRHFFLFVYGSLIVELNGYGKDIQKLAEKLESCLRES